MFDRANTLVSELNTEVQSIHDSILQSVAEIDALVKNPETDFIKQCDDLFDKYVNVQSSITQYIKFRNTLNNILTLRNIDALGSLSHSSEELYSKVLKSVHMNMTLNSFLNRSFKKVMTFILSNLEYVVNNDGQFDLFSVYNYLFCMISDNAKELPYFSKFINEVNSTLTSEVKESKNVDEFLAKVFDNSNLRDVAKKRALTNEILTKITKEYDFIIAYVNNNIHELTSENGPNYKRAVQSSDAGLYRLELMPVTINGITTNMVTVNNDNDFRTLPPGLLVYHRGLEIPKVVLTNSYNNTVAVPLYCRMWQPNVPATNTKYTIYNPSISTSKSGDVKPTKNFYVDEYCSKMNNIPEDRTRGFRNVVISRNNDKKPTWFGHTVFRKPSFGDCLLLQDDFTEVRAEDARDLYQYSLWMLVVSMFHNQFQQTKN